MPVSTVLAPTCSAHHVVHPARVDLAICEKELDDALTERGAPGIFTRLSRKASALLASFSYHLLFVALSSPRWLRVQRSVWKVLRKIRPLARAGRLVLPTRHEDVIESLKRPDCFNVGESLTPRMPAGEVIMCIDWRRRHAQERQVTRRVLESFEQDDERVREIVDRVFERRGILRAPRNFEINVARDLVEDIVLDVVRDLYGLHFDDDQRDDLRRILRLLASRVFQRPPAHSRTETEMRVASDRLMALVNARVEEASRALHGVRRPTSDMTILEHLVVRCASAPAEAGFDHAFIRRTMGTLVAFGSATTARAMTQAIYQLLTLPGAAGCAYQAARDCDHAVSQCDIGHARKGLLKVVFEALRFNPMLPILGSRTALRDTVLAFGETRQTRVRAGDVVLPLLLAAMFDDKAFEAAERFCPAGREIKDYLHFGAGQHECVARRIAEIVFEQTLFRLFSHDRLRLGGAEKIIYDGPAVETLMVVRNA